MRSKALWSLLFVPVALLISLLGSNGAEGETGITSEAYVAYEAVVANSGSMGFELERIEVVLPPGVAYVGLAVGSQVTQEGQRSGNRIVWQGPLELPPNSQLRVRYWLAPGASGAMLPEVELFPKSLAEQPEIELDTETLAEPPEPGFSEPVTSTGTLTDTLDSASPEAVTVEKTTKTPELLLGDEPWVAYVVTFTNSISTPAALDWITDTMAPGLEFVGMAAGSDVGAQPTTIEDSTVVWAGPLVVPGDGTLRLCYWVKAPDEEGVYPNSIQALGGSEPVGPAEANVTVRNPAPATDKLDATDTVTNTVPVTYTLAITDTSSEQPVVDAISDTLPAATDVVTKYVYLPFVGRRPGLLMQDTFDTGVKPEWTPFTNWPDLTADIWDWTGGVGWGRYDFDPVAAGSVYNSWGLNVYEVEGAEDWTNYRVSARLRSEESASNPMAGVWFRGTYTEEFDKQGGDVTGYYFLLKPKGNWVYLAKIKAGERKFNQVDYKASDKYGPGLAKGRFNDVVVEVQGSRIRCWVDDTLMIDWTDPTPWEKGGVGLVAFRGGAFDHISAEVLP